MNSAKCIELEFPDDGRRKATLVTDDEIVCKFLKLNPDARIGLFLFETGEES